MKSNSSLFLFAKNQFLYVEYEIAEGERGAMMTREILHSQHRHVSSSHRSINFHSGKKRHWLRRRKQCWLSLCHLQKDDGEYVWLLNKDTTLDFDALKFLIEKILNTDHERKSWNYRFEVAMVSLA
jgi:hypothetical protein